MPETKLVPGLRITLDKTRLGYLRFNFEVGLGASSKYFATNSQIRKAISTAKLPPGFQLGYYAIAENKSMGGGYWVSYEPFLGVKNFNKKGIAQILEYRVLEKIKSDFPKIKRLWHHSRVTVEREEQLKKRGFSGRQLYLSGYTVEEALLRLRQKIANDTLKARRKIQKRNPKRRRMK